MVELVFNIGLPFALIILAMLTGTILEKRHFQSIKKREQALGAIATLTSKDYPTDRPITDAKLVEGAVVVSIDYFKRLLASLRMIFGGEVQSHCSLLDRARRQAILRMKSQCPDACH